MSENENFNDLYLDNEEFEYKEDKFELSNEEFRNSSPKFVKDYLLYSVGIQLLGAGYFQLARDCFHKIRRTYEKERVNNSLNQEQQDSYTKKHKDLVGTAYFKEALLLKYHCPLENKQKNEKIVDSLLKKSALLDNVKAILYYYHFGENQQLGNALLESLRYKYENKNLKDCENLISEPKQNLVPALGQ